MSPVVVRRRPDGIVQILPRPRWQAAAGSVPAAIAALVVASSALVTALALALTRFPVPTLLLCGCAVLGVATSRWAFREDRPSAAPAAPPPPRDVA